MDAVITFDGRRYRLNLDYRKVLDCYDVLKRQDITDVNQVDICLDILAGGKTRRLSPRKKAELFRLIYDKHIRLNKRRGDSGPNLVDFRRDFDLIFASFYQAYHIDLTRDKLDWYHFYNLFQGLPAGTKIREVMDIRQREIPAPNKHNQKEIIALQKLKNYWCLPASELECNYASGIHQLFNSLANMAGR